MCELHWIEWWENQWKDYYDEKTFLFYKKRHLIDFELDFLESLKAQNVQLSGQN